MKYQKIVQASDRIFYLVEKQGSSYQGIQKSSANSDSLWNAGKFLAILWQVKNRHLLLCEHIHSTLWKDFF